MLKRLKRLARDEGGVTAIEYALIAMLIAMVIVAAVTMIGQRLVTPFGNIANNLPESA